ncbi:MAG: hypothetical protein JWM88_1647 [Verrucomicrobia bacterium]|nr:hypothetical protein [Verrucomicrobiota bacterium]
MKFRSVKKTGALSAIAALLGLVAGFAPRLAFRRSRPLAVASTRGENSAPAFPAADFIPGPERGPWRRPVAQSRGEEWLYDVFTPPKIYHDVPSGRFAVIAPNPGDSPGKEWLPQIRLVAVKHAPFRLQLLGCIGGNGHYIGSFEDVATGDVFLASAGTALERIGLKLEDIHVEQQPLVVGERIFANQWLASAEVTDVATGRSSILWAGRRTCTDELLALVAVDEDGDEEMHEVRRGEEFEGADRIFRVERIELNPPAAELSVDGCDPAEAVRVELALSAEIDASEGEPSD